MKERMYVIKIAGQYILLNESEYMQYLIYGACR